MEQNALHDLANNIKQAGLEKRLDVIQSDMMAVKDDMHILMSEINKLSEQYSLLDAQLRSIENILKTGEQHD